MKTNRLEAAEKFAAYVKNYNVGDEKIRLKIEHTYKVADLCGKIAQSLQLSEEQTDRAWLSVLLHDIGPFDQRRRFGP
ncbi:MAG: HD domain-containing protein [Lachnospiraceae bacterium]|nr:HD domain-containing protein [Lachnospiraceae bacterium]